MDSEINAQINFASEWGSTLTQKLPRTIEEAIEEKEAELRELKAKCSIPAWETTTSSVGVGKNLDTFKTDYGKRRNEELMPAD